MADKTKEAARAEVSEFQKSIGQLREEVGKMIVGNRDVVDGVLTCMLAGSHALSADILASVRRDGVIASATAFFGVVLVVLALSRFRLATPLVLGSLVLGVLGLAALAITFHIRINFAKPFSYNPAAGNLLLQIAVPLGTMAEEIGRAHV